MLLKNEEVLSGGRVFVPPKLLGVSVLLALSLAAYFDNFMFERFRVMV